MSLRNSFWQDKNVFVTGAAGLLGSWLTQALVSRGANVTALVRDYVPGSNLYRLGLKNRINIVRGALEDYSLLERSINEYEVDTVFHLAAQAIVGAANRNPLATFEANIRGTWNLLEACRRNQKIQRIVVASSDKAYGEHEKLPYNESCALQGTHPYDVSKSCTDLICRTYFVTYKLPVCTTRCGNIYGGGDLNFNRIVPGTILSVLKGENPVIRSDGLFIRDYIYVEDIVSAYLFLAEKMDTNEIHGEAFNFSNEQPINVRDLVQKILQLMGRQDLEPVILNEASNEIVKQYLSSEKAKSLLGWVPQYTLDNGLNETINWYTSYLKDAAQNR
ncbi:MAG: sugar dehydratase [Nitrospira bacterium SG8_35_4]|nr:MAG: sugar dehydratase [Nitrospira bacterium SG8_35_4]